MTAVALVASLVATVLALALSAPAARASGTFTFCVSDATCVTDGGTSEPSLQAALSAADAEEPGTETIDLGAGTFTAPNASGFTDSTSSGYPISIVGSGVGTTTLAPNATDKPILDMYPDQNASLSNVTVALNNGGTGVAGVNHVTNVAITDTGSNYVEGMNFQNGSLNNVTITLPQNGPNSIGIYRPNGTMSATNVTITAGVGIGYTGPGDANGQQDTYTGLRIFANEYGINIGAPNGSLAVADTLTDSEIEMTGANSVGVEWGQAEGNQGSLDASFLTIVGDGSLGSTGVVSYAAGAGTQGAVNLSDSIVTGFADSLQCYDDGSGTAAFDVSYSDFNPSTESVSGCSGITSGSGNINLDPQFDLVGSDETLSDLSPAIDAGDPSITGPLTDLAGNPRPVDGGIGTARVDMGAFEYQSDRAPTAVATPSTQSVDVTSPASFSGSGSTDPDSLDLTYSWSFDDGGTATGSSVEHTFTTVGTHHATLTVSNTVGLQSTSTVAVTVTAPPFTLTGASFHPSSFKPGKSPHGTKLHYMLSNAGAVTVAIAEKKPGKKKGTFTYVSKGSLHVAGKAGANTLTFSGTVAGKRLPAGTYRATLTAHDSYGQNAQPATATFKVSG